MVATLLDPPKTKTCDSLNVFRSKTQEGFICICKGKKSFIQEESGRQGGPRMDDAENQDTKIQFLHYLIKSRT